MNHIESPPSDRLVWVDTETTGLYPDRERGNSRVIDLCVMVTDPHLEVLDEFNTKIKLSPIDRAAFHPKAMAANKYTDAEWADAPENGRWIWERVAEMTKDRPIYGQNVPFDISFLTAEMARFQLRPGWDRRIGDTQLLTQRVKHAMGLPNAKLETAYPAVGGPPLSPHRARPDVLRAMFVYYRLVVSRDGLSSDETTVSDRHFTKILERASAEYVASLKAA